MCGFAGFVGKGDMADLKAMTDAVRHRGPDDEAYFSDPADQVFLGFRRLAVIDREGGRQPMSTKDGELTVVYNGEIYNHIELRRSLEAAGYRFRTDHSDTEVLLHGYHAWGTSLPERLDGMFAFVLWDRRRHRLFCARDRFGEKPFYFAEAPGIFAFGSEITALHAHPDLEDSVDPAAVQKYFAYGYVPAPRTLFRRVRKLPPGSHLIFDLAGGGARVSTYWRFAIEAEETAPADRIPALAEEFRGLFATSVSRRLIADVPLGVNLSGGIDSTAILAYALKARGGAGIDSFTVGFVERSYDEADFARRAAAALGSRHHERILDLKTARAQIPDLLRRLDDPFADPSILPTSLLAGFARESVTVTLSGDGGDELFAGYDPFAALGPAALYRRLVPAMLHRVVRWSVDRLPRGRRNMSLDYRLRRALRGVTHRQSLWNPVWLGPLAPEDFAGCFEDPLPIEDLYAEAIQAWDTSASCNPVDRTLEFYTNFYLPEMILAKADRASMGHSLECRAPFLDRDLVEFCRRLPHGYKRRGGVRKFLLKTALRGVIPDFVIERPKKGFGIPLADWLRSVPSPGPAPTSWGMRPDYGPARWAGLRAGTEDERLFLWADLCLAQFGGRA